MLVMTLASPTLGPGPVSDGDAAERQMPQRLTCYNGVQQVLTVTTVTVPVFVMIFCRRVYDMSGA